MPDPVQAPAAPAAPAQTPPAEPAKPVEPVKAPEKSAEKPVETPAPKTETEKPAEKAPEKPAEPAKTEEKKAEQPRGDDGKFVAAELKVPEGVKVDEKLMETFKALAPTLGISTKQAQALLDMQVRATQEQERLITESMQKQRVADLEKLKGDPEFGGARFDETVRQSKSILSSLKFGPAVSKKLEAYGLDCDPDFTKFLAEIRSLIAEDSTSSRLTNPAPERNGTQPMSQIDRQAATYRQQPRK